MIPSLRSFCSFPFPLRQLSLPYPTMFSTPHTSRHFPLQSSFLPFSHSLLSLHVHPSRTHQLSCKRPLAASRCPDARIFTPLVLLKPFRVSPFGNPTPVRKFTAVLCLSLGSRGNSSSLAWFFGTFSFCLLYYGSSCLLRYMDVFYCVCVLILKAIVLFSDSSLVQSLSFAFLWYSDTCSFTEVLILSLISQSNASVFSWFFGSFSSFYFPLVLTYFWMFMDVICFSLMFRSNGSDLLVLSFLSVSFSSLFFLLDACSKIYRGGK